MKIIYCASTLGGTARGVGILRELGGGVLVTPFREVVDLEDGIVFFGHVPLSCQTLILDKVRPRRRGGNYDKILIYGEDIEPGPVLPRQIDEMDLQRAEAWWQAPPLLRLKIGRIHYELETDFGRKRTLSVCSSYRPRDWRDFRLTAKGRVVCPSPELFYWPAMELMALADEVHGGGIQVQAERLAVENQAARVAADIKRAKGPVSYSFPA